MAHRPPSISRRISLRFLPDDAQEPTSTLVLNAGGASSLYTDFRPLLADPAACEWAFAGEKEYFADGRCAWTHEVDSRAAVEGAPPAPDVGHCQRLPNGDELETGEMINPTTGKLCAYEEVWRDEDVMPGTRAVALRLSGGAAARGIFVQVGDWAQAIVQQGREVSARRWHFVDSWRRVASFGEASEWMPSLEGSPNREVVGHFPPPVGGIAWAVVADHVWKE